MGKKKRSRDREKLKKVFRRRDSGKAGAGSLSVGDEDDESSVASVSDESSDSEDAAGDEQVVAFSSKIRSWREALVTVARLRFQDRVAAYIQHNLKCPCDLHDIHQARRWMEATVHGAMKAEGAVPAVDSAETTIRQAAAFLMELPRETSVNLLYLCVLGAVTPDHRKPLHELLQTQPTLPAWAPSTEEAVGPPRLDRFLGLARLTGPVSYRFLEPKQEWLRHFPHLPTLVFLGDRHLNKRPCVPKCVKDLGCRQLGQGWGLDGDHDVDASFLLYLDTDPTLAPLRPDLVLESWLPRVYRVSEKPRRGRPNPFKIRPGVGGPLMREREALEDCVGPVKPKDACPLQNVRVHVADVRRRATETREVYQGLFVALRRAIAKARPSLFLEACRASAPHWAPATLVQSFFSLNALEDIDNEFLATERPGHEFFQLDPRIQAEIRILIEAIPDQHLPYDLARGVQDWLEHGRDGDAAHPFLVQDVLDFFRFKESMTTRGVRSVDLYAISRLLKKRKDGTCTKLGILFAGHAHCVGAAYLLHTMYNEIVSVFSDDGCLNFQGDHRPVVEHREEMAIISDLPFPVPHTPMVW